MIRQSEDSQGRADSFDSAQDELAQPFFVGVEEYPLKMRCAGCVSFIYNGEGHGKVAT
jgi:hypothetical protein